MSRVLKSSSVVVDEDKRVRIDFAAKQEKEISKEQTEYREESKDGEISVSIIEKATRGADFIIESAKKKASRIMVQAEEEANELRITAMDEARQEGYEAGYAQGMSEAEQIKYDAQAVFEEAAELRRNVIENTEQEILELIVRLISKLLTDTVVINPQVIMVLIRQGLDMASSTGKLTIRVSADDYDSVINNKHDILKQIENSSELEIIKDLSLNKADCIIETPLGNIDCSLSMQANQLIDNLYYIYENDSSFGV